MQFNSDRLALEVKRARVPFVWFLVLVVLGVIGSWIMFRDLVVQWPWQETKKVKIALTDAKGIVPGQQQVRIAGVPVGLISAAKLERGQAIVTLSFDKDHRLPIYKNARIRLRPVTPLQDMYAEIESRGTKTAGELGPNDVLNASRTDVPVDISRVLNTFDPDSREHLGRLIDGLGGGLENGGKDLEAAFASIAPFLTEASKVTGAIGERRKDLARLVSNLGELTAAINTRDGQISSLVKQGNATLGELAAHDQGLSATLSALPGTLDAMRTSFADLRSAQTELDPALRSVRPITASLKPALEELRELSAEGRPALTALRPAVKRLRPLARALEPTARDLQTAVQTLQPQLPRLDRATQKIQPCKVAFGKFFQWTPSVFKFYDSFGAFPRGELAEGVSVLGGTQVEPNNRRSWTCTQKEGRP